MSTREVSFKWGNNPSDAEIYCTFPIGDWISEDGSCSIHSGNPWALPVQLLSEPTKRFTLTRDGEKRTAWYDTKDDLYHLCIEKQ